MVKTFKRYFIQGLPIWGTVFLAAVALTNLFFRAAGALPAWFDQFLSGLSAFAAVFLGIFIEAAPFLLLGTIASGVVEVFISREDLARMIPKNRVGAVVFGALLGVFFPVCECGVVPFTRRLMHKGLPPAAGIALLLAAPVVNPVVIASTFTAYGPTPVFFGRLALTLTVAVAVGLVFSLQNNPEDLLRPDALEGEEPVCALPPGRMSLRDRLQQLLLITADEFFEMGRYLVAGALMAALMQTVVPQSSLLGVGQGPLASVLVMIALAVILSICSTVDAFISLAFVGTFTTGSILSFLVFGPMVDIKSTLMFLQVFKKRTVAAIILLPLSFVVLLTVAWNYLGY